MFGGVYKFVDTDDDLCGLCAQREDLLSRGMFQEVAVFDYMVDAAILVYWHCEGTDRTRQKTKRNSFSTQGHFLSVKDRAAVHKLLRLMLLSFLISAARVKKTNESKRGEGKQERKNKYASETCHNLQCFHYDPQRRKRGRKRQGGKERE